MRFSIPFSKTFFCCLMLLTTLFACNKENKKLFNISEGPAEVTLKAFASQAEIEILYDPKQVEGFQTQAVSGKFPPEEMLELMLRETSLEYSIDPKTHAYAVFHPEVKAKE